MNWQRLVGVGMLLVGVLALVFALFAGVLPAPKGRSVVTFNWSEFAPGLAGGLSLSLLVMGCVVTCLAWKGDAKIPMPRAFLVFLGLCAITVAFFEGPYLCAIWLGRSDAWFSSVREIINWVLTAGVLAVTFIPIVAKRRLRQS